MSKSISLLGVLLLLAVLASSWFIGHTTVKTNNDNHIDGPSAIAFHTSITTTGENGQLISYFSSPKLLQPTQKNSIFIFHPHIIFYDNSGQPKTVNAHYGKSIGDDRIELWGNVKVYQKDRSNQQISTLSTSALIFYPQKQYAETDQPVVITQSGTVIHATGLKIDLKTGNTQLMSHVKVQYDPKKTPS